MLHNQDSCDLYLVYMDVATVQCYKAVQGQCLIAYGLYYDQESTLMFFQMHTCLALTSSLPVRDV